MVMKAIVSGHSRGLGAAIAAELLERGIAVMGLARQRNDALQARFPDLLAQHEINLADSAALAQWLGGSALADFFGMDDCVLLINNAGTVHPVGALGQLAATEIADAVSLNVSSPLMLASAVAAHDCRERRILHLSSGAARDAYPGWAIYCASKAALDHHARAAAQDGSAGLRICSIAPGVIDTDMQAELRAVATERFPLREHFHSMHRDNQLSTPASCAARLVDFVLAPGFGAAPTASLT
jgi:NAD(P)-dependent dehydrogenase (short-subunit alcohol dehydrogenase family)